MITKHCQLCGSKNLVLVIDLGSHPLADTFLKTTRKSEKRYPLKVLLCKGCGYVTLQHIVPATTRYQETEYSYTSSNSPVAIAHFKEMAQEATKRVGLSQNDLAVDVGSNAGTLLQSFKDVSGCAIVGIEPSPNIARLATRAKRPTLQDFFSKKTVAVILKKYGKAKVITCTNVFNHITDLQEFMENTSRLLEDDGIVVIETPYLLSLVRDGAFDTIYLEHVSYFAVTPFEAFFKKFGFHMLYLQPNDYMGGSIRIYLSKKKKNPTLVWKYKQKEKRAQLFTATTYQKLMKRADYLKTSLVHQIATIKKQGGKIIGIGAATKGNTLLNYCGITQKDLEFVTDSSPLKIGKFTPGSHIPIKSDKDITKDITHAVILPWNIAGFLTKKLAHLKLIFIIPHLGK